MARSRQRSNSEDTETSPRECAPRTQARLGNDPTARILKRRARLGGGGQFEGLGNDPTARILKHMTFLSL